MKKNANKYMYILIFIMMTFSVIFLSNYIILGNYAEIEDKQNKQNISDTIINLTNYIQNIETSVFDHASWDDTYQFIDDLNTEYVDSNFPAGGDTLENLNIDILLFANKENNIIFTSTQNKHKESDFRNLADKISTRFKNTDETHCILKYDDKLFVIIKKPILKSDNSGDTKGYLYGITSFQKSTIKEISRDFDKFDISFTNPNKQSSNSYLAGFFSETLNKENMIIRSNLHFFSKTKTFIFSLKLENKRELYNQGKKVVLYFNIFTTLFFLILVFVLYKIQKIKDEKVQYKEEVKNKFLSNMSHELRTPLNAINGFCELLIDNEKKQKNLEYLQVINNQTQHMLFMINDILDFGQIEEGNLTIENKSFNLHNQLQNITVFISFFSKKKNIEFSYDFKEVPTHIITDELKLSQILINLLNNAVKFTKEDGKIKLTVKYNKHNNTLEFEIQDTGIGIDKNKMKTIFNGFEQLDSRVTKEFEGIGIGLSISLAMVKLLGGKNIEIKSKENFGSTFSFFVPVTVDESIQKIQTIEKKPLNKYENRHILLVEDNITNQHFMALLFKKININFDIAQNGQVAIDKFKQNKYDLILMDENMPIMNGIEATRNIIQIEKEKNLKHTPIIALTANALKEDRDRFLNANLDEHISKPLKRQKLIEILDQFIK